jgi:hypothetical protein
MRRIQYALVLPLEATQYPLGQLYVVAAAAGEEAKGSEDHISIVVNEERTMEIDGVMRTGQYTEKHFHLDKSIPRVLRVFLPKKALVFHETCFNAALDCGRVITRYASPAFSAKRFEMSVETQLVAGDRGTGCENPIGLSKELLATVQRDIIDIVTDPVDEKHYEPQFDLSKVPAPDAPLAADWRQTVTPIMTSYKLVTCHIKLPMQKKIERTVQSIMRRIFLTYHRRVVAQSAEWRSLSLADIRKMEAAVQAEIATKFANSPASVETDAEVDADAEVHSEPEAESDPADATEGLTADEVAQD